MTTRAGHSKIRIRGLHHLGEAKRVALATNKLDVDPKRRRSEHTLSAMRDARKTAG